MTHSTLAPASFSHRRPSAWIAGALLATFSSAAAFAATITVPGFSFESQAAPSPLDPIPVTSKVDSWQRQDQPVFWDAISQGSPWSGTSGLFQSDFFYANEEGHQAMYVLNIPGAGAFQDFNSTDWQNLPANHAFDAKFTAGNGYQLTLGLFGKNMDANSSITLSLYYRDGSNNKVTVGSTTIQYNSSIFAVQPNQAPNTLHDYTVNVPIVQTSDAWAGKNIGIDITANVPLQNANGNAYWDMDNVRLSSVPEPGSVGLLTLGAAGMLLRRGRRQA
jgi:hypothetical protein